MSTAADCDRLSTDATVRTEVFWGVDCGSAEIKVAALDREGRLLTTRRCRTLFPLVIDKLRDRGVDDVVVFGGGIIPEADIAILKGQGVAELFTPGAPLDSVRAPK